MFLMLFTIVIFAQEPGVFDSTDVQILEQVQKLFGKIDFSAIAAGVAGILLLTSFLKKLIPKLAGWYILVPVFAISFAYSWAIPSIVGIGNHILYGIIIGAMSSGLWETVKKTLKKIADYFGNLP